MSELWMERDAWPNANHPGAGHKWGIAKNERHETDVIDRPARAIGGLHAWRSRSRIRGYADRDLVSRWRTGRHFTAIGRSLCSLESSLGGVAGAKGATRLVKSWRS